MKIIITLFAAFGIIFALFSWSSYRYHRRWIAENGRTICISIDEFIGLYDKEIRNVHQKLSLPSYDAKKMSAEIKFNFLWRTWTRNPYFFAWAWEDGQTLVDELAEYCNSKGFAKHEAQVCLALAAYYSGFDRKIFDLARQDIYKFIDAAHSSKQVHFYEDYSRISRNLEYREHGYWIELWNFAQNIHQKKRTDEVLKINFPADQIETLFPEKISEKSDRKTAALIGFLFTTGLIICFLVILIFTKGLKKILPILKNKLADRQKICLGMSAAAVVLLFMAISSRWGSGFYIFLRWVVCLALVGKLLEKFPAWFKFILIVGAIIYNPIAPIHIGNRNDWLRINWITLPIIVSAEIITIKKAPNNGTAKNL